MMHFAFVYDLLRKWDAMTKRFLLTSTITIRINLLALLWGKENILLISLTSISYKYLDINLYVMQSKMPLIVTGLTITEMLTFEKNGQQ